MAITKRALELVGLLTRAESAITGSMPSCQVNFLEQEGRISSWISPTKPGFRERKFPNGGTKAPLM